MDRISDVSNMLSFHPLNSIVVMVSLALIPFLFLSVTSFVKISVVFNILRNAIGANQVPSGAITSLLSLVLTLHIMAPVGAQMLTAIETTVNNNPGIKMLKATGKNVAVDYLTFGKEIISGGSEPLIRFLTKHANIRERILFAQGLKNKQLNDNGAEASAAAKCLNANINECPVAGESFVTLLPAFLLSELQAAFVIGFAIFLPFLAVDLVVSNILIAMGMTMVTPATVSLPFKLLLFVISDAWYLLCRSLILSY